MSDKKLQTEQLLATSAQQYAELLQHSRLLPPILDAGDVARVREHALQLQQMQALAGQLDEGLLPRLGEQIAHWEEHPLYRQRLQSIQAIVELNNLLLPRIRGMMAVTASELEQMREGRTALAGYAPAEADRRSLRGVG